MVSSKAQTVADYLDELPDGRRAVVARVRATIRKHLPKGYVETMNWGMITYGIPLARYPDTYNGQPLCYVGLAAQKNNYALYLMGVYGDPALRARLERAYQALGRKPDMGKSCLRFKRLEDLPLGAIGELVAAVTPDAYIAHYEAARRQTASGKRAAARTRATATRRATKP